MGAYWPDDDYDLLHKVVLMGDSGVGKSNLISRLTKNEFSQEYKPTFGVPLANRSIKIDGKILRAQIWEAGGPQERLPKSYYRGAVGALVVYDVTRPATLEGAGRRIKEIRDVAENPNMLIMLVGNKADEARAVSTKDAMDFAVREGVFFMEVSALQGMNVEKALAKFCTLASAHIVNQKALDIYFDAKPAENPCVKALAAQIYLQVANKKALALYYDTVIDDCEFTDAFEQIFQAIDKKGPDLIDDAGFVVESFDTKRP